MPTKISRVGHLKDTMMTETMAAVGTEVIVVVAEAEIVAAVDVMIEAVVEAPNPEYTTETIMSPEVVLHKEGNTTKVVLQEVIEEVAAIKVQDHTTEISQMMKDLNELTTNMITEEAATEMHPLVHSDQEMMVKFPKEMNLQEKILKGQEVWGAEMAVLVESSEWA